MAQVELGCIVKVWGFEQQVSNRIDAGLLRAARIKSRLRSHFQVALAQLPRGGLGGRHINHAFEDHERLRAVHLKRQASFGIESVARARIIRPAHHHFHADQLFEISKRFLRLGVFKLHTDAGGQQRTKDRSLGSCLFGGALLKHGIDALREILTGSRSDRHKCGEPNHGTESGLNAHHEDLQARTAAAESSAPCKCTVAVAVSDPRIATDLYRCGLNGSKCTHFPRTGSAGNAKRAKARSDSVSAKMANACAAAGCEASAGEASTPPRARSGAGAQ